MFAKPMSLFLSATLMFFSTAAFAQSKEAARRRGFYEHKKEERQADIERERGLREFLQEQAAWDEQRERDRKADQKRKKQEAPGEDSVAYKRDRERRLAEYEEHEALREKHLKAKKAEDLKDAKEVAAREAWAMEEYGLDQQRPRFDLDKRVLFGAKPSGMARPGGATFGGGGSSSSPGSSVNSGGNNNTPYVEPPAYNEFDGYVPPPPAFPDGGFSPNDGFVPPPPPAFPGGGGEFDGGFYPPPPPPPPGFDGGF